MKLVKVTLLDHFTSEKKCKDCRLEVVGWIVKRGKRYLTLSNCLQDKEVFHGNYFNIINSAIISVRSIR